MFKKSLAVLIILFFVCGVAFAGGTSKNHAGETYSWESAFSPDELFDSEFLFEFWEADSIPNVPGSVLDQIFYFKPLKGIVLARAVVINHPFNVKLRQYYYIIDDELKGYNWHPKTNTYAEEPLNEDQTNKITKLLLEILKEYKTEKQKDGI